MVIRLALLTAELFYAADIGPQTDRLTVHEWGTFTSIADASGTPQPWLPLSGPPDLPCFVHRSQMLFKSAMQETVRMETPVLYFYSPKPVAASVHVTFLRGMITEWYPRAAPMNTPAAIDWTDLAISHDQATLLREPSPSHYYAARNTEAMSVESGGEHEKLLFYRGVGSFDIPVQPALTAAGVSIRNTGSAPLPLVMVFENHGGKIGYTALRDFSGSNTVDFAQLKGSLGEVRNALEARLIQSGLYPLEAAAMLETWRDSWFEPGVRVFYVLPQASVDKVLPLSVRPQPVQTVRAFVGRVELLAPWMRDEIVPALRNGDTAVLAKYGRFLDSYMKQIGNTPMAVASEAWLKTRLDATTNRTCSQ